jgi:hypothetical protein
MTEVYRRYGFKKDEGEKWSVCWNVGLVIG